MRAVRGDAPVVTHLHGTELKMLDASSARRRASARARTPWWAERMVASGAPPTATVAISPHAADEAVRLLGISPETVHVLPDGVDAERFSVRHAGADELRAHWRRLARAAIRSGWDEATAGRAACATREDEVPDAFHRPRHGRAAPVLLYVGRFLRFKRVPLLIRAYARARERMAMPGAARDLGRRARRVGGRAPAHGGQRAGAEGVFFAGWRGHDELPLGLASRRLLRRPVDGRALRARLPRGDGLAGCR